jgi:hypothetical protein
VPALVQSGDLDGVTPISQGRAAAAQFANPTYGIVANAGHTPDYQPCGVAMAIDFVKHLRTDPNRCRQAVESSGDEGIEDCQDDSHAMDCGPEAS